MAMGPPIGPAFPCIIIPGPMPPGWAKAAAMTSPRPAAAENPSPILVERFMSDFLQE